MRYLITQHAAERYQQRVKPHLTVEQAHAELSQLAELAEMRTNAPAFLKVAREHDNIGYLMIGDDIALPVTQISGRAAIVKTCLARQDMRAVARRRGYQQRQRESRRNLRAARQRNMRTGGGVPTTAAVSA